MTSTREKSSVLDASRNVHCDTPPDRSNESKAGWRIGGPNERLLESMPSAIALVNSNGRIQHVNNQLMIMFGYGKAELLGQPISMLVPTATAKTFDTYAPRVLSGETLQNLQVQSRHKVGRTIHVRLSVSPQHKRTGGVRGLVYVLEDVTELKGAQDALHKNQALLQAILDNTPVHLHLKDLNGRYRLVNQRFADWWGLESGECIGKTADDLLDNPEELELLRESEQRVIETGEVVEKLVHDRGRDGKHGDWLLIKFPVAAPDGSVEAIGTVSFDVSERNRLEAAEQGLLKNQTLLQAIIDNTPFHLTLKSAEGKYLLVNDSFAKWWSRSPDEFENKYVFDLIEDDAATAELRAMENQVMEQGAVVEKELRISSPSGDVLDWLVLKFPISTPEGTIDAVGSISVDITDRKKAEALAQEQREQLDQIVRNVPEAVIAIDQHGIIETFNPSAEKTFGYVAAEAIGRNVNLLMPEPHKSGHDGYIRTYLETGNPKMLGVGPRHVKGLRKDGSEFPLELAIGEVRRGKQRAFVGIARDISDLLKTQKILEQQNERFNAALDNMSQGLVMFDGEQRLIVCNKRFAQLYDLPKELTESGTPLRAILENRVANGIYAGDDPERYVEDLVDWSNFDKAEPATQFHELSDERTMRILRHPIASGGWLVTHEDVTEQRRVEERIAYLAHHDHLTGLPNRVMLRERMKTLLERAKNGEGFALLCLDLDGLKGVNDTLGHPVGDELLKQVGERLRSCVRESDMVARLGGDEFAIIQNSKYMPQDAMSLAERICYEIGSPYNLKDHQIIVGTSIGIAIAPSDGSETDLLLNRSDMALYRAKSVGRGSYRLFDQEMETSIKDRRTLGLDLRKALANGELEVYYQPIINLEKIEVSSFEALLRWHHPQRGLVSPAEFIPIAERIGFISQLGEWVLRQACAEASTWSDDIKVAVNASPAQFKGGGLISAVVNALATTGLPAGRLELEITESVLLQDDKATLDTLHQLRDLGVHISLDDFGTGYSSLSYLSSFPFDKIKIDRSFISNLSDSEESFDIVQTIVGFASSLSVATVAEGVETRAQLEIVRKKGCTEAQGFLFSPPKPASHIARFLERRAKRAKQVA